MLIIWDLGFSSLVLFVFSLIFPLFGFIIRRKWRLHELKKEEIKRLLVLASEEAARAETEAHQSYSTVPLSVGVSQTGQCAVCGFPTSMRCSRCKAVKYCSGKCQIIHWHQGHKEECHAAEAGSDFIHIVSGVKKNVHCGQKLELENKHCDNKKGAGFEEFIAGDLDARDSGSSGESVGISSSESSSDSFPGFSPSNGSESSDDASTNESISPNDIGKSNDNSTSETILNDSGSSDEHKLADVLFESSASTKIEGKDGPLSPKFASLVDSLGNYANSNKLNLSKSGFEDSQVKCKPSNPSSLGNCGIPERLTAEPSGAHSGLWGGALKSMEKRDANENVSSTLAENVDDDLSVPGTSLHFSFNLSGSGMNSVHSQSFGKEPRDGTPTRKPDNTPSLAKSLSTDGSGLRQISSTKGKESSDTNPSATNKSNASILTSKGTGLLPSSFQANKPASVEVSSVEVSSVGLSSSSLHARSASAEVRREAFGLCSSSSPTSKGLNYDVEDAGSRSRETKPGAAGYLSSCPADACEAAIDSRNLGSLRACEIQTHSSKFSQEGVHSSTKNGLKFSVRRVVDQVKGAMLSKHVQVGGGTITPGKSSDKGFFPYELFIKLYMWKGEELHPCGLTNCGNSCYANAVLQCLVFTPPLTAYFLQGFHSKTCMKKDWCFTCEFERLVTKIKEGRSPVSPFGIVSRVRNIGRQLNNGREEDAHEFLRYAIDAMQSICLGGSGRNASGATHEETTLLGLTFGGYLRSKIKCMRCHGKSERREKMMDLTVEIDGDIGTLEEALRQFTRTETLDGENKYQCSRCKSYEKAKKKMTVLEAPNVLTIALKRFQSGKFGKLNKSIRFPEILNLAPFMTETNDRSVIYKLYGVIVHLDIMNAAFSGHYVCYVKNNQNRWFKIDDSTVRPAELDRVLTKGAYMLLYSRCSPRPPQVLCSKMISPNIKSKAVPARKSDKAGKESGTMHSSLSSSDYSASGESFYSEFRLQRILEDDSSSDNSSLFSSNSDGSSSSADSLRDSSSYDDLSDYIFGDSSSWTSPWRNSSHFDTASLSSAASYLKEDDSGYSLPSRDSGLVNPEGGITSFFSSDVTLHPKKFVRSSDLRETDPRYCK